MRAKKLAISLILAIILTAAAFTAPSYTENRDAVLLAKTIYALGRTESYETKLALARW